MTNKVETASGLRTYTKKEMWIYLTSMTGQNMIYNIIGACLAYYLQFTILIPAITVSIIMALARVWDAFNDPMMGTIVDRTRTKFGKCRPFLMAVPIPIIIITIACFTSFGFYGEGSKAMDAGIVAWAAFTYVLYGMIYTIGDIPLWGVTALMTESDKDRNKLLSLARIFGGVGGGIVLLSMQSVALGIGDWLTPTMDSAALGEKYGFLIAATVFALIGGGLFQLCGFFVKERIPASKEKTSLKQNFKIMWRNKPFRQVLLSGILSSPKMLIAIVAMPIATYYFASKDPILALVYLALLGGGMFLGQFIAMAIAPKMLTRFSKKNLYNFGNLFCVVPFVLIFVVYVIAPTQLVHPAALAVFFVLFALAGAGNGLSTVLQSFMVADAVDYEEYHYGTRPDGVFFSGQTFIAKLTSGIATILSGIAYAVVGFSDARVAELNAYIAEGGIPRYEPQYQPFMMILFFLVSIPPAIGCILSIIPTWKYALDDDEHKKILAELNERRHQAGLDSGEISPAATDAIASEAISLTVDDVMKDAVTEREVIDDDKE